MALVDKVNAIKELVSLVVTVLPKFVDVIIEICSLIREAKADV